MYHAVSVPSTSTLDTSLITPPEERVFESMADALKCLKSLKKSRLKSFSNWQEAAEFAADTTDPEAVVEEVVKTGALSEGCPYKSLTPQELKQLKEAIKAGDEDRFRKLVDSNPRYLMTPCDTPSVIHSGTRANPLHVAAGAGNAKMTSLVLEHVQDPDLVMKMCPDESKEARARRQEYLLDLYLNSHLKGTNDTPLHQAAKIGAIDIVALLVQHSSCDTKRQNRDGQTPSEAAGSRMTPKDPDLVRRIRQLLCDHLYIPVYRVSDKTEPSFLGEAWSPRPLAGKENQDELGAISPILIQHQLSPSRPDVLVNITNGSPKTPMTPKPHKSPFLIRSPQQLFSPKSPLPDIALQAVLGPVSQVEFERINKEWRRPATPEMRMMRLKDPVKGLERQGRELAKKCDSASMIEYWDFLDAYCDLSSPIGLEMLDEHLRNVSETVKIPEKQHEGSFLSMSLLEKGFAGLNLHGDENQSPARSLEQTKDLKVNETLDILKIDVKLGSEVEERPRTFPLSPEAVWNRPRDLAIQSPESQSDDISFVTSDYDDDDSSVNSYHTVATSFESEILTAEEGSWCFINGENPTDADDQVYQVIKSVDVDRRKYPYLSVWKDVMEGVVSEEGLPLSINLPSKFEKLSVVSKKLF